MNNTNINNSTDVNIIGETETFAPNNAYASVAPVSAAEAFARSCEEIKAFCPQEDDDEDDKLLAIPPPAQDDQPECDLKIAGLRAKIASKLNVGSSLPQIAIKAKVAQSTNANDTEIALLNGDWDILSTVPTIVAEMHNVNLEELLVLKEITTSISNDNNPTDCRGTGLGGKQMKLEGVLDHSTGGFTSMMTHAGSSNVPVFKDTSSPLGSDSGIEGDSTDGNLSWLLNYKINELPPVPDQQHNPSTHTLPIVQNVVPSTDISKQMSADPNVQYQAIDEHGNMVNVPNKGYATVPVIQTNQTTQPYQFVSNNPPTAVAKYSGPRKPPFTYTELIEHALVEKRELTVSGIYQWISDHFPFYKQNDDRWKNSVRHNLSINPHFRKGSKAVHGAGHLWTIAQKDEHHSWQIKRQKMQQFIKTSHGEGSNDKLQEIELANATASILPSDADSSSQSHSKRMQPKNVAIEYVIDMSGGLGEQVVEECGLTGDYLITDLHPAALGLNMSEGEILNADNLYDDLNFPTYELQGE